MAAVLLAAQLPEVADPSLGHNVSIEVAVFETFGHLLVASFDCGSCLPNLHWGPLAPALSIALAPFPSNCYPQAVEPQIPGACVWDAATRTMLCMLSTSTIQAAWQYNMGKDPAMQCSESDVAAWSPSGRKLLLIQQQSGQGVFRIYDMFEDRAVAESFYTTVSQPESVPAAWYSDAQGLILGAHTTLHNASAFADAHIALGHLPDHCFVTMRPGMGLSSDAQLYLAPVDGNGSDTEGSSDAADTGSSATEESFNPPDSVCLLRCSVQGLQILFTPEREFEDESMHWGPNSSQAFAGLVERGDDLHDGVLSEVLDMCTGQLCISMGLHERKLPPLVPPLHFSPSGRLLLDSRHPRIFEMHEGDRVWWTGERGSPEAYDKPWDILVAGGQCVGWLPSGRGLVFLITAHPFGSAVHRLMWS